MHKNVVATPGEGSNGFNFNQWLIKNDLMTLKSLFTKYGATSISSLRITSPEMQRLMIDMEFLSKPQMVPKVVTATHQLEGQKEVMKIKTVILSEREQVVIDDIKQKLHTVDTMEAEVIGLQSGYPKSRQRIRNMKKAKIEKAAAKLNETFNALIHSLTQRKRFLLNQLRSLNDCDDVNGDDDEKKVDELTVCSETISILRQFLKQKEGEYHTAIATAISKEERRRAILKIGKDVNNRFGVKQSEIEDTMDMMKRRITANNKVNIDIDFISNDSDQMIHYYIQQLGAVSAGVADPLNSVNDEQEREEVNHQVITDWICPKCSSHNELSYKFCTKCGTSCPSSMKRKMNCKPKEEQKEVDDSERTALSSKLCVLWVREVAVINDGPYTPLERRQTGWIIKNISGKELKIKTKLIRQCGDLDVVLKYEEVIDIEVKPDDEMFIMMDVIAPNVARPYDVYFRLVLYDDPSKMICDILGLSVLVKDEFNAEKEAKIKRIYQMGFNDRKKIICALQKLSWNELKAVNWLATH